MSAITGQTNNPDVGLAGHWKLHGDCNDYSGNDNHGESHGVDLSIAGPDGRPNTAARFDGRHAYMEVPSSRSLSLGTADFSISAWTNTDGELDDVIGDIASKYDPDARQGFNFNVKHHAGMPSCTSNYRNVHFGIDNAHLSSWQDCGRPGEAIFVCAMAVHNGKLYTGTYEYDAAHAGHVYRYAGDTNWEDCGSPDRSNAVTTLAVYNGQLYAGSARLRAEGSALPGSPNRNLGGHIYRHAGGKKWIDCGTLPLREPIRPELSLELPHTDSVDGLVVFRGELYAVPSHSSGVFKWDGESTWSYCGIPGNQRPMTLGVWDGSLYCTGNGGAGVWRYVENTTWEDCGQPGDESQIYSIALYQGEMYVGSWPTGSVWRYQGGKQWLNCGQLGEEKEVMAMAIYNGKLYCGTLPLAQVYRYDGDGEWTLVGRLDHTPDVTYRRVWTMAVCQGKLFAGTLPSGHVYFMEAGKSATIDYELPPGWHHLVAVKGPDRLQLYLDGKSVAASASFDPAQYDIATDQPLKIGFGAHDYFNGCLSDVRLYNRAVSDSEAKALFESRYVSSP